MPLIEWTDNLSVGIDSIDEQHKKLVNIINALNDAILSGESNNLLIQIFNNLATYTNVHFTYEENMFAEFGYPDSVEHKKQHEALIAQLIELKQEFNQIVLNQLVKLVYDVRRDDAIFRQQLTAQGFDNLRKNYPIRREFSAVQVTLLSNDLSDVPHRLGFSKA